MSLWCGDMGNRASSCSSFRANNSTQNSNQQQPFPFSIELIYLLPQVVCGSIFSLLSIRDLQCFDAAHTSHSVRCKLRCLWESYVYNCPQEPLDLTDLQWLVRRGVTVYGFAVAFPVASPPEVLISSLKHCIISLEYDTIVLTNDTLVQLAHNCPQLEILDLPRGKYSDIGVMALAQHCHSLRAIHLQSRDISDAAIEALCQQCPHMRQISFSDCAQLTDNALISIASSYPQLYSLDMSKCSFSDASLTALANQCHVLKALTVANCPLITRSGHLNICVANPNLVKLDLCSNRIVTDSDIMQLIDICPYLQVLTLFSCPCISDTAIICVAHRCTGLQSLTVAYCGDITDASLLAIGQHVHQLVSLDISNATEVTNIGLASIAEGCRLLQKFFAFDVFLSDHSISLLGRSCQNLCTLDTNSKFVGFGAMTSISTCCPLISELCLCKCDINDACLYTLARYSRNLSVLLLTCCDKITHRALHHVLESCRELRIVDVSLCRNISRSDVDNLTSKFPRVKIYSLKKLIRFVNTNRFLRR